MSIHVIAVQTVLFFCSWRHLTANEAVFSLTTDVFPILPTHVPLSLFSFLHFRHRNSKLAIGLYGILHIQYNIKATAGSTNYTEDKRYSSSKTASSSGHYETEILFLMSKVIESHNFSFCHPVNRVLHRPTAAIPASVITFIIICSSPENCRSHWPRGLRRRSSAARLLRMWVPISLGAWMFVCCECCVLPSTGLCDGLITRPEESYRLWRVVVCDQENSKKRGG